MTNNELIKWCLNNLGSPSGRQTISCNWTRNNFEYLKNRWPHIWKYLCGKELVINDKTYCFKDNKSYEPVIINGHIYNRGGSRGESVFIKKLVEIYNKLNDKSCISLIKSIINILEITKGTDLLKLIKICYPDDYKFIMKIYGTNTKCKREIVYRYANDIKELVQINGIPLKFGTYSTGYRYGNLYNALKSLNCPSDRTIVKTIINTDQYNHCAKILKLFYPKILKNINEQYSKISRLDQRIYLYVNKLLEPPKCLMCQKKNARWTNSYTENYGNFCSKKCQSRFYSIERFVKLNKYKLEEWKNYNKICRRYTNAIYKKYRNEIDPNNLRSQEYELDHVIPIAYGFLNGFSVPEICHPANLKIISRKENRAKGMKVDESKIQDIIKRIKNENS